MPDIGSLVFEMSLAERIVLRDILPLIELLADTDIDNNDDERHIDYIDAFMTIIENGD